MQHSIPQSRISEKLGPQAFAVVRAVEACVHCGFCLPVCPTYQLMGQETDSPRGRILLMKSALEGELSVAEVQPYINRCLGCLACATTCPSGVHYGDLVGMYRAYTQPEQSRSVFARLQQVLIKTTLPNPDRFRMAAKIGNLARPIQAYMPDELANLMEMLPPGLSSAVPLPQVTPAIGTRRARVAFLAGCVQQVLAPQINLATLRVLARNGVEVIVPPDQGCCGAILAHMGDLHGARRAARRNLRHFPPDVDAVLTNAAGCGSGMREYPLWFEGQADEQVAIDFAAHAQDVSEFLIQIGLVEPPGLPVSQRVAYHDACHLLHGQGISEQPRSILRAIPNLELVEIIDSDMCCGSAGTYNLLQPELAGELGHRKAESILNSGARAVAMGNIGCMIQVRNHLQSIGSHIPVLHTLELLDQAYQGKTLSAV